MEETKVQIAADTLSTMHSVTERAIHRGAAMGLELFADAILAAKVTCDSPAGYAGAHQAIQQISKVARNLSDDFKKRAEQ